MGFFLWKEKRLIIRHQRCIFLATERDYWFILSEYLPLPWASRAAQQQYFTTTEPTVKQRWNFFTFQYFSCAPISSQMLQYLKITTKETASKPWWLSINNWTEQINNCAVHIISYHWLHKYTMTMTQETHLHSTRYRRAILLAYNASYKCTT